MKKQESFGTSLYTRSFKGRINRELNKISKVQRPEFEHLETFSFLPNSGYAFVVGEKVGTVEKKSPKEWEIDIR